MNKFINRNTIFSFLLGMMLCGSIVYAATYYARDVFYTPDEEASWEVSNVNEAINSLYANFNSGDASSEHILAGKTAVVKGKLVEGTLTSTKEPITIPSISGHNSAGKTVEARLNIDVTGYNTLTIGSATCTTGASTTTNNTVKVTDTETSETLYTGKRTAVNNTVVDLTGHNKIRIIGSAYWEAMEAGSSYQVTVKNIVIE